MAYDYEIHQRKLEKSTEEQAFLNNAVRAVYNECPDLHTYKSPYSIGYGSTEYKRQWEGWNLRNINSEAEVAASLKRMTPEQKQGLLHRHIESIIWNARFMRDGEYNPLSDLPNYVRWTLKHGLTFSQKAELVAQIRAFWKYLKYQQSPQYAIDKINRIKKGALGKLDQLGDSYRSVQ